MKVLFITNWYPTHDFSYGGVFVREHARAVAAAGNEVVVLHLARASKECRGLWKMEEELDPELREGIPAYHVFHRMLRLRGTSYPLYLYSAIKAFRRLRANGFEPDVIHAHIYDAGVPAVMIGKRNGIPVVATEQFTGLPRRFSILLESVRVSANHFWMSAARPSLARRRSYSCMLMSAALGLPREVMIM